MGRHLDRLPLESPGGNSAQGAIGFNQVMLAALNVFAKLKGVLLGHRVCNSLKDMLVISLGDIIFKRMHDIAAAPEICPVELGVVYIPGKPIEPPENNPGLRSSLAEMVDHIVELIAFLCAGARPNVPENPGEDISIAHTPAADLNFLLVM
ncbi:MAG: hypothetical protein BA863_00085 [Desulfovibrio sp. S3730MH75]|nr:MAG: hypothetical protein BA863_00085 [Desulfovibrio sp. S3730MH75]